MNKIKAGKAPGVCGIYPEYIQHGGNDAIRTLHKIVTHVWKEEMVPEEWHQGIIIPLYKGKGSKSECSNYRVITLLSVPGKVFAHVILARLVWRLARAPLLIWILLMMSLSLLNCYKFLFPYWRQLQVKQHP